MNERKLTKSELAKREDIIMKMKDNKRALVQKYGKDAEAVMYGRATNLAKTKAEAMDQDKLREMIKDALQNPKKADLNKDGKLSDYEEKRGAAIEKSMIKEWGSSDQFALHQSMHRDLGEPTEFPGLTQIMYAAGDATEFYMDDFPEYETDREDLIMNNARSYARKYFPEFMANAAKLLEPLDEKKSVVTESKEAGLDELKGIINQASALGEEARSIIEAYFPSYSAQGEAYGVFDFVESSNPYDTTLVTIVEEIEADEDSYEDEDLNEDLDLGHEDDEPHMLKADLYRIGKYAMDLYQMMDKFEAGSEEVDFPHWWQSKIINAKTALVGAKHYLDFEVKEPSIDAVVDTIDDIAPEMEVDVVDDIEEGNLGHNETASLEQEGRFWVVTYSTMDGKKKKTFQSEDEARKFYNTLDEGLPKSQLEGSRASTISKILAKQLKSK